MRRESLILPLSATVLIFILTTLSRMSSASALVVPPTPFPAWFNRARSRVLTKTRSPKEAGGRCVVYYMFRDQRVDDNWAMLYSKHLADLYKVPLRVVFPFTSSFDQMSYRQFAFQAAGLKEVESSLRSLNIPFSVPLGPPPSTIPSFSLSHSAVAVVTDHLPLRTVRGWNEAIAKALDEANVPLYQVDASCIVPVWIASDKQEVGARTLRPKITKLYQEYLTEFPKLEGNAGPDLVAADRPIDWEGALGALDRTKVDMSVLPVAGFSGGKTAGLRVLDDFLNNKLKGYGEDRNDPNKDLQSGLSAYLRFGQVGFQRVALATKSFGKHSSSTASFIEEGVVRRELSDNFCFYNHDYDSVPGGAARWASESLESHRLDARAYVYDLQQFEEGRTHDDLWNAAQLQLRKSGRMHGFLRMYWAKKILEWTADAQTALRFGTTINDKYAMDGSSPNGYVGVGWSIMGVHDMGWTERGIFGKIRYMNYDGCLRKFKVKDFVSKYPPAAANAIAAKKMKPAGTISEKDATAAGKKGTAVASSSSSSSAAAAEPAKKKSKKKRKVVDDDDDDDDGDDDDDVDDEEMESDNEGKSKKRK